MIHFTKVPTHIPLTGTCNTRHLGGYQTSGGVTTKPFAYIRSEAPSTLTGIDVSLLLKLGIRTVIDLRNPSEIAQQPALLREVPSIDWHNIPIFQTEEQLERFDGIERGNSYCWMLDAFRCAFGDALRLLSQTDGALFHCAAGKDRTGLLSMLLLLLAGVEEDIVVQEYCYTQTLLAPWVSQELQKTPGLSPAEIYQLHGAYPEFLYAAIDHLLHHYHGITGYLQQAGLSDTEISLLKSRLISRPEYRMRYSA